jgi:hypothetical protein
MNPWLPPLRLGFFAVRRCESNADASIVWKLVSQDEVPVREITYGTIPPGFRDVAIAVPLTEGRYIAHTDTAAAISFLVLADGHVRPKHDE